MKEAIENIKRLIGQCSSEDQETLKSYLCKLFPHPLEKEWEIDSDTILEAIRRSSDLTKRGVRGILAEAIFESQVIPKVKGLGWEAVVVPGNLSYDAYLQKGASSARIQIKLQRLEKQQPKLYYPKFYKEKSLYVVEVQKTRSGEITQKEALPGSDTKLTTTKSVTTSTRPYRFTDFDILAVNLHPSSHDWKDFRYALASSLLPRQKNPSLIEIFQPVSAETNEAWTDDLGICLKWYEEGSRPLVLTKLLHSPRPHLIRKAHKKE
jgi:hypothetical protein